MARNLGVESTPSGHQIWQTIPGGFSDVKLPEGIIAVAKVAHIARPSEKNMLIFRIFVGKALKACILYSNIGIILDVPSGYLT